MNWRRLFGFDEPKLEPQLKLTDAPCTPAMAVRIEAQCCAASAHEDELFDRYNAECRKRGKDFDFKAFFHYAGENWRMEYDPYGYRDAFLKGVAHPYGATLDGFKRKAEETKNENSMGGGENR